MLIIHHADIEENAIFNTTSFVCSKGDARDEIRVNLNGKIHW